MTGQQIRRQLKKSFDRIRNEKYKQNLLQAIPFWVASLLTGLIAVFYSRIFAFLEGETFSIISHYKWLIFILTPLCFFIAWWVVVKFAPYARGSGIPQVMAAIELDNPGYNKKVEKLLSIKIFFVKIISSFVMILGGGAIGREGPTIQLAGTVFRKVNEWLPAWWPKISKRNMIMTGAAAGLAAAFNTPLGGIVFAVEELTKTHISYFKTALFSAVIIAGLTAQGLLGPYLYLGYPDVTGLSVSVFLGLILVAAIAGLLGSIMSKVVLMLLKWKSKFTFRYQHALYVVGCAFIVASIAFFFDERVLGSGKEVMITTLFSTEKNVHWYTAIFRILGIILSFTTGAAGGIFAPSLGAGAGVGSLIAGWLQASTTDTNLLILCGMAGFLTGVTHTPFTSAILVLEMTDRHNVIFHLMIAAMVASIVSMVVDKHSLYDHLKVQCLHDLHHEDDPPPPQNEIPAKTNEENKTI
ncbi:MAG: chloride channel protein [Ginsengibacter sp.]